GPLPEEEAAALARGMLRRVTQLPEEFVDNLVDMTGGNPFHMEQAVRVFVDGGAIDVRGAAWRVNARRALQIPFPISVEDAVQARLDALTPVARAFLQKAACIGNVFWVGAVEALGRCDHELSDDPELWMEDDPGGTLEAVIAELLESDYVLDIPAVDSSIPGERELCFKHNMEKDLAYRLLGEAQRRRYHLTLAQWLESRIRDSTEEQLEYIARNFAEGGVPDRAARYWLAAGDKARVRYANDKAIEFYMHGLGRLGPGDSARRMEALHSLGSVLALRGETDAAREAFAGMLRLAYTLDLRAKAGAAHNRIGRLLRDSGDYAGAMKHLGRGLALFRAVDDQRGVAASLDDLGKVFWLRGSYDEALQTMQEGMELRRALGDPRSIALSLNNIGLVLQDSGDYAAALQRYQQALEIRRRISDIPGVINSLNNIGVVHQELGEDEKAIAMWKQGIDRCEELGDRRSLAALLSNTGEACRKLGRVEEAHEALHRAVGLAQEVGDRLLLCEAYRNLGEVFLDLGDLRMADEYCQKAMKQAERLGSQVNVGVVSRALGEISAALAKAGDLQAGAAAAKHFERAIEILSGVGNDHELARCMATYGKFLEARGDKHRGQRLQERARDLFEGFKQSVRGRPPTPAAPPRA
ncbi:MAG TPA: tetratricopeptide repeat protein, partial [Myxococcota bacterium]|nr:tetratricopeptide repeat protein [Myxococcota bacterium]